MYTSIFADRFWIFKVKQEKKKLSFDLIFGQKCRPSITKCFLNVEDCFSRLKGIKDWILVGHKYQPKGPLFSHETQDWFWHIKFFLGLLTWSRLFWFYYERISDPRESKNLFFCAENYERVEWNLWRNKNSSSNEP